MTLKFWTSFFLDRLLIFLIFWYLRLSTERPRRTQIKKSFSIGCQPFIKFYIAHNIPSINAQFTVKPCLFLHVSQTTPHFPSIFGTVKWIDSKYASSNYKRCAGFGSGSNLFQVSGSVTSLELFESAIAWVKKSEMERFQIKAFYETEEIRTVFTQTVAFSKNHTVLNIHIKSKDSFSSSDLNNRFQACMIKAKTEN